MSSLRRRLLRVAAAAMLAHAGTTAFAAEEKDKEKDKDAVKRGITSSLFGEPIEHLALHPIHVSVIRDGQVASLVSVGIVLETKGIANREKVIDRRQRVQDAFLRELHGLLAIQRADGQTIDPGVAKIRLMRVAERVLGPGVLNDILVQNIAERPMM